MRSTVRGEAVSHLDGRSLLNGRPVAGHGRGQRVESSESRSLSELRRLTNALVAMGMLGSFPDAQFSISGVLGPTSTASGQPRTSLPGPPPG